MSGAVDSDGEREPTTSASAEGSAPQEHAAAGRAASRRIAATIGDVVAVLSRSPEYQNYTLADLHWMVFPAVIAGQCAVAYSKDDTYGVETPVAVVCWAMVSEKYANIPVQLNGWKELQITEWTGGIQPLPIIKAGRSDSIKTIIDNINDR
jgi:hemolysin-activating ACP:hemolysin acyltransferase